MYDKYGSFGLHIAEQFGDDVVETLMMFRSGWFQVILIVINLFFDSPIMTPPKPQHYQNIFIVVVRILDVLSSDRLLLLLLRMLLLLLLLWEM